MKHLILVIFSTCLSIGCFGQWGAFRLKVETKAAVQVGTDSARFGGIYNIIGTKRSDEYVNGGIQWGRTPNLPPFVYTHGKADSTYVVSHLQQKDSLFGGTIDGLLPNTKYYVRACLYAGWGGRYTPVYGNVVSFTTGSNFITNNTITTSNQVLCIDSNRKARILLEASQPTGGHPDSGLTYKWQYRPSNVALWNNIDSSNIKNLNFMFDVPKGTKTILIRRVVTSGTQHSESAPVRVSFLDQSQTLNHSISVTVESQTRTSITLLSKPGVDYGGYSMKWQVLDTSIADTFAVDTNSLGARFSIKNPSKKIWVQSAMQYLGYGPNECPQFFSSKISFTDPVANGNVYPMIEIGEQYWMINNLRAERYTTTRPLIYSVNTPSQWANTSLPAVAYDSISTWDSLSHGLLYNQYVISDTHQICPVGWQIPTLADWTTLIDSLGGFTVAGRDLKLNRDWTQPLFTGTNPINFNALPTGIKQGSDGVIIGRDSIASFWTQSDSGMVQYLNIYADTNIAQIFNDSATAADIRTGRSIRCMKNGDGSEVISNNLISTQDTGLCVSSNYQTQISLYGRLPSGGLNSNFSYEWEMSTAGNSGPWAMVAGADSLQNYATMLGPFNKDSVIYYRRKISSGMQQTISNVVSIKFNSPRKRDTSIVNISQFAGNKDTLVLKASSLGNAKVSKLYWTKSLVSDTSGFTDIIANDDSITLVNPKSNTWIQVEAHTKMDNGECRYNHSRGIGFTPPDGNGNIYLFTTIGKLRWMTKNLRATLTDSIPITQVTNGNIWGSYSSPAYCWYNNDSANNAFIHGGLYNIHVVLDSTSKVCPSGWNIPEVSEWNYLVSEAGGILEASVNLRLATAWVPTTNIQLDTGKNTLNFNSQPGGYRVGNGVFGAVNKIISMWLFPKNVGSTVYGGYTADVGQPGQPTVNTGYFTGNNQMGRSIRCVQSVDGSIVISNNSIFTPDTSICSSAASNTSINLRASTPSGGLNNQYSYQWQYTDSANLTGWKTAPGSNSSANYTVTRTADATVPTIWLRRVVESGHRFNYSKPVSITYIDSTGIRGHVDVVNISQIDGGTKSIIKLKNKSLPKADIGIISWFQSSVSDSSGFARINGYRNSSLSILNPDTNMWYFSTRSYYDTISRSCVADTSPVIGFTPRDGDSNIYAYVKIGIKYWTVNNIRATSFNNGTPIELIDSDSLWKNLDTAGYCWYNDSLKYASTYGGLYNHFVLNNTNDVCPFGWHAASTEDWAALVATVGDSSLAGEHLKTIDKWKNSSATGTNSFNFNALPSGFRAGNDGNFKMNYNRCYWWKKANPSDLKPIQYSYLIYNSRMYHFIKENALRERKRTGLSVRCVKD